jgi:hypothetical protein
MLGLLAAVVASVIAPARLWAAGSDTSPDDAPSLMVMADFNHDGIFDKAEIVSEENGGTAALRVSLGRGDGTFQQMGSSSAVGNAPRSIVSGDFNRDGIPDVVVGDDDGSLKLFLGSRTGDLVSAGDVARLGSVVSIAVADFNGDGIPDMAVSDWRTSEVAILLGAGNGSFERGWSFPLRMRGTVPHISTADFNGDGIPDLVVVYGDDDGYTYDVMVGNGKGAFTKSPNLGFARDPNAHCPA